MAEVLERFCSCVITDDHRWCVFGA